MGDFATTAPYGGMENTFDIAGLTIAAGASFVARSTVYHAKALERMIEKALRKVGFSLVEIMSPCPTAYGKINKKGVLTPEEAINEPMEFFNRLAPYCGKNLDGKDILVIKEE